MSKQANKKVAVRLKNIRDTNQWYHKGLHQKTLSNKLIKRLQNGEKLRLMTINAPKHTTATLAKKHAS
jgi:hypothetical protein